MSLRKLISIASPPLGPEITAEQMRVASLSEWGDRGAELFELLCERNGFYALESSLLVRGIWSPWPPRDIVAWNSRDLWVGLYERFELEPMLFFSEDVFGNQCAISSDQIVSFDPETGTVGEVAQSLDEWAGTILGDCAYHTGYPVAHEWQLRNGPLQPGTKLLPKVPFVCGGKFSVGNLGPVGELEAMAFRADLANQIKDLPDGAQIRFRIE